MTMDILADDEKALNAPDPRFTPKHDFMDNLIHSDFLLYAVIGLISILLLIGLFFINKEISKTHYIDFRKFGLLLVISIGFGVLGYIAEFGLSEVLNIFSPLNISIIVVVTIILFCFSLVKKN